MANAPFAENTYLGRETERRRVPLGIGLAAADIATVVCHWPHNYVHHISPHTTQTLSLVFSTGHVLVDLLRDFFFPLRQVEALPLEVAHALVLLDQLHHRMDKLEGDGGGDG